MEFYEFHDFPNSGVEYFFFCFSNSCKNIHEVRDFRNSGVAWLNFRDFSNYEIELYEFHEFRDSGNFVFFGFHDSCIEFYDFYDFRNSGVEF